MPDQPSKNAARRAANRAYPTVQACEVCGAPQAERHHPDYTRPLLVRWLCTSCHGIEHRGAPDRDALISSALFLMGEGLTQRDISAILGVSRSTMHGWFRRPMRRPEGGWFPD